MSIQQTVYEHFDIERYSSCWPANDQARNEYFDKISNKYYDAIEAEQCAEVKRECKALWMRHKQILQQTDEPMPCSKPPVKVCWNNQCNNEVSWQWGDGKNWCAGDRCVDTITGSQAEHFMKMNCIRMELRRHWEKIEQEVGALEAPATPPHSPTQRKFESPNSVKDLCEKEEEIFPMDLDEFELLSDDSLICDIKEICDGLAD